MNPMCQQVQVAAIVCLAVAYVLWFPFAILERPMFTILKWFAILLTAFAFALVALGMPWYCEMCEIR
jgi:threonine/homoserine efflux transporter RhtA